MRKAKGLKVKLKIIDATSKLVLGGQRGASLDLSADTLDATTKDSDGWQENETGFRSWSTSADGLYVANNDAYKVLLERFMNGEKVDIVIEPEEGTSFDMAFAGKAIITSFPLDMPYDDMITYNVELTGDGKLEVTTPTVTLATIKKMEGKVK